MRGASGGRERRGCRAKRDAYGADREACEAQTLDRRFQSRGYGGQGQCFGAPPQKGRGATFEPSTVGAAQRVSAPGRRRGEHNIHLRLRRSAHPHLHLLYEIARTTPRPHLVSEEASGAVACVDDDLKAGEWELVVSLAVHALLDEVPQEGGVGGHELNLWGKMASG